MPILKGFKFELLSGYSNAVFKPFYVHDELYCLVLDHLNNIMNSTFVVIRIPVAAYSTLGRYRDVYASNLVFSEHHVMIT